MITLTLNLSKKVEQELEKDLKHLEKITKKSRGLLVFPPNKEIPAPLAKIK